MESGVDDAGLHSPLLGGYTATEVPPNTPHGAQGSSTTPSALPHGSGLGQDPQQPHAQHQARPQFQQRHGSPQAIPYAPNAPFGQAMPNVYSQPTAYNGTPQMHGHSIMPQHNMPQLYNIAPQHMHAYTPRYTAAAIPPYQMGTQHSAVIQQALLQQLQGQAGHMGAQWMHTGPQYGMLGATTPNAYTQCTSLGRPHPVTQPCRIMPTPPGRRPYSRHSRRSGCHPRLARCRTQTSLDPQRQQLLEQGRHRRDI